MINLKNKRLLVLQIVIWVTFYLFSIFIYKVHYGIHLDLSFSTNFTILFILFFLVDIWLISIITKPKLEEAEEKLYYTEKKLNEDKDHLQLENRLYKILFESIEEPFLVINQQSEIFFHNNRFLKLFSLKEENKKFKIIEVTRNLDFQNYINLAITQNRQVEIDQFCFSDKEDPNRKYFSIKIIPIKFSNFFLIVFNDITEKKIADQIREDFISNFSHEIRTPLTILNGQIQNLRNSNQARNQNELDIMNKIENNSRRLTNLFDDMLSLTSIEKQKNINYELIKLEDLINIVCQDMQLKYPQKNIEFKINIEAKDINGDYNLIEQAFLNLIDNAIKYSSENPIVEITSEFQNNNVIISIKDSGRGIPEEQKHRIFERFFRVDYSRNSQIVGTGLGLAIVKHIIQKHNGKIKVDSKIERGSCFIITLPKN